MIIVRSTLRLIIVGSTLWLIRVRSALGRRRRTRRLRRGVFASVVLARSLIRRILRRLFVMSSRRLWTRVLPGGLRSVTMALSFIRSDWRWVSSMKLRRRVLIVGVIRGRMGPGQSRLFVSAICRVRMGGGWLHPGFSRNGMQVRFARRVVAGRGSLARGSSPWEGAGVQFNLRSKSAD